MYDRILIENFRGFERFELTGLGRINLLVGQNNSGKSSLLEAVHFLATSGNPWAIMEVANRRGEVITDPDNRARWAEEIDPSHLFFGHRISLKSAFSISGTFPDGGDALDARVISVDPDSETLFRRPPKSVDTENLEFGFDAFEEKLGIEFWSSLTPSKPTIWELSRRKGLAIEGIKRGSRNPLSERFTALDGRPVKFVSTAGQTVDDIVTLFERFVLSPQEDFAIKALQVIEPTLERIATRSNDRRRLDPGARGGIVLRFKGNDLPVPIGSMGDGMWRMLGMALALAAARGGILLVDEIDTGLHYTTMDRMWKLLDTAARELSVQVFATTHSRDCVDSLAVIAGSAKGERSEATIHRIERNRQKSVAFTGEEIIAAAERGIEVR